MRNATTRKCGLLGLVVIGVVAAHTSASYAAAQDPEVVSVPVQRLDVWVDCVRSWYLPDEIHGVRLKETRAAGEAARRGAVAGLRAQGFVVTSSRVTSAGLGLAGAVRVLDDEGPPDWSTVDVETRDRLKASYTCIASGDVASGKECAPPFWIDEELAADAQRRDEAEALFGELLLTTTPVHVTPRPLLCEMLQGDALLVVLAKGEMIHPSALPALAAPPDGVRVGATAWAVFLVDLDDGAVLWRALRSAKLDPVELVMEMGAQAVVSAIEPAAAATQSPPAEDGPSA